MCKTESASAVSDLKALLTLEEQKQMVGCSDQSCIVQIAGAMGADCLMLLPPFFLWLVIRTRQGLAQ